MADVPIPDAETAPNLDGLVLRLVEELYDPDKLQRLQRAMMNAAQQSGIVIDAVTTSARLEQATTDGALRGTFERAYDAVASWALALVVQSAFDVPVSEAQMAGLGRAEGRKSVAAALTRKMIDGLTGGSTSIAPSEIPAANYLNVVLGQVLENWVIGAGAEVASGVIPFVEQIQTLGDLSKGVVNALGIGESSARVLRPYIDNLVVEPLRRHIDQTYRPTLHAPGTLTRLVRRKLMDEATARGELALLGWSDERITDLLQDAVRELPTGDALTLFAEGDLSDIGVRHALIGAGYDEATLENVLRADQARRVQSERRQLASAAIAAYADRWIERPELEQLLTETVRNEDERKELRALALARRLFNVARLSIGDLEEAVKRNLIALPEYRRRLADYGFREEDIIIKQLLLQAELRDASEAASRRAALEAQRAAEQAQRAAEKATRREAVEAERARQRRGPIGAMTTFAVRGLLSLDAYAARLALEYDPDIVDLFVEDAQDQRARYLADLERRAALAARAAEQDLSLSQLERAVMRGFLSPGEYAAQLLARGFDAGEAGLLRRLVEADLAERAELERRRKAAEQVGTVADLTLSQWERLVRRGVRSLAAYRAALEAKDFASDDAAALVRLLEIDLAEDAAAAGARAGAISGDREKELSLSQLERLVTVGDLDLAGFRRQLVTRRYSPDAVEGITRLLELDLAELAEQRAAREGVEQDLATRGLSLSNAERAVREGVWTLQQFAEFLAEQRYGEETQAVLLALIMLRLEAQAGAS